MSTLFYMSMGNTEVWGFYFLNNDRYVYLIVCVVDAWLLQTRIVLVVEIWISNNITSGDILKKRDQSNQIVNNFLFS